MAHLGSPLTLQLYKQKPHSLTINKVNFIWLNVDAGYVLYLDRLCLLSTVHASTRGVWPIPLKHTLGRIRARVAINTLL